MKNITASNARSDLFNLLKKTVKGHTQTRISSKDGNAILISEDDYESLIETAKLMSISGLTQSIKKADQEILESDVYDFDEVFK